MRPFLLWSTHEFFGLLSASDMLLYWRANFCGATPSNNGIYTRSTGAYSGGPSGVDPKLKKAIRSGSRVTVYRIEAGEDKKKEGPDVDRVVRRSLAKYGPIYILWMTLVHQ